MKAFFKILFCNLLDKFNRVVDYFVRIQINFINQLFIKNLIFYKLIYHNEIKD
jgi:hypothetical protein